MSVAVAEVGHNAPPQHEIWAMHIDELFAEASNWCDGEPIDSQNKADEVGKLLDMIRTASKDCDKQRAKEKKPHDDAGKAVQALYKPLLDKAEMASSACKRALTPWLQKLEDEKRAAAAEAARIAEEKAEAARAAAWAAEKASLAEQAKVEALRAEAEKAEKIAARADKDRAHATGGQRAVTLRTSYKPVLVDAAAALKHYRDRQPDALKAWLTDQARQDVRAGSRSIPGFEIEEVKEAV